jgi:hypothetical protein
MRCSPGACVVNEKRPSALYVCWRADRRRDQSCSITLLLWLKKVIGMFFKLVVRFFFCLSRNRSINIEYDKIIWIYSERAKFLVLETLDKVIFFVFETLKTWFENHTFLSQAFLKLETLLFQKIFISFYHIQYL